MFEIKECQVCFASTQISAYNPFRCWIGSFSMYITVFLFVSFISDIFNMLLDRVVAYHKGMVPPRNKPYDPKGNPPHNGRIWGPWRTLDEMQTHEL